MTENTIVMASDSNYAWGAFLMLCSIRMNKMDEPVLILAREYTDEDRACVDQFPDVQIVDFPATVNRNMTCSKPIAMLLAKTEYITWVDCDGIFAGNCSGYLTAGPNTVHFRMRGREENYSVFRKHYRSGDQPGSIPKHILDVWREDVRENDRPLFDTCGSACFFSVHRNHRYLLEKWRDQIDRVLASDDVGVVDTRSTAYFQTDESVLNSVLCFSKGVEMPGPYKLDKDPQAYFVHFVSVPKPWQMWTSSTIKHYEKTLALVEWASEMGLRFPKGNKIPFSLKREYKLLNHIFSAYSWQYWRVRARFKRRLPSPISRRARL